MISVRQSIYKYLSFHSVSRVSIIAKSITLMGTKKTLAFANHDNKQITIKIVGKTCNKSTLINEQVYLEFSD